MGREEVIAIRVEPKLKREVELLAKILHVSTSEWIRTRLATNAKKLFEDLRYQIILAYLKREVGREELKEIFGDEVAGDIEFVAEKTKKDLLKSEELAKIK